MPAPNDREVLDVLRSLDSPRGGTSGGPEVPPRRAAANARAGAIVAVWTVCILLTSAACYLAYFHYELADSAPKQAVVAAVGCLGVMATYVIARALSEILSVRG